MVHLCVFMGNEMPAWEAAGWRRSGDGDRKEEHEHEEQEDLEATPEAAARVMRRRSTISFYNFAIDDRYNGDEEEEQRPPESEIAAEETAALSQAVGKTGRRKVKRNRWGRPLPAHLQDDYEDEEEEEEVKQDADAAAPKAVEEQEEQGKTIGRKIKRNRWGRPLPAHLQDDNEGDEAIGSAGEGEGSTSSSSASEAAAAKETHASRAHRIGGMIGRNIGGAVGEKVVGDVAKGVGQGTDFVVGAGNS